MVLTYIWRDSGIHVTGLAFYVMLFWHDLDMFLTSVWAKSGVILTLTWIWHDSDINSDVVCNITTRVIGLSTWRLPDLWKNSQNKVQPIYRCSTGVSVVPWSIFSHGEAVISLQSVRVTFIHGEYGRTVFLPKNFTNLHHVRESTTHGNFSKAALSSINFLASLWWRSQGPLTDFIWFPNTVYQHWH